MDSCEYNRAPDVGMDTRIFLAAGLAIAAAAALPGIFDSQGWRMASWLGTGLVVFIAVMGSVAVGAVVHSLWRATEPIRKSFGLRWPFYRRDRPNPLQWLLDEADRQRDNPLSHLVFTERLITHQERNPGRPYVRLNLTYHNYGVHALLAGMPFGNVSFGRDRLERIELEHDGQNTVPANHIGVLHFDLYIPPALSENVFNEIDSERGLVSLDFGGLTIRVQLQDDTEHTLTWRLDSANGFFTARDSTVRGG